MAPAGRRSGPTSAPAKLIVACQPYHITSADSQQIRAHQSNQPRRKSTGENGSGIAKSAAAGIGVAREIKAMAAASSNMADEASKKINRS